MDQLPALAGTSAFAAKESEVEDLERTIGELERAEQRAAKLARPIAGGGAGPDVTEINPSQRTISQIRAMDPRPGKLKGFDDYLVLARKGLDFTPRAASHYRSFGEQLQSIFKHYSSKGSDTDPRLVRAPTGAGEATSRVVPGAIANAFFDATGVRLRRAPLTPERVKAALART